MLRNVILIGAFLGVSASVPILYQSSPETFHEMVGGPAASEAEPEMELSVAAPAGTKPSASVSGRRMVVPSTRPARRPSRRKYSVHLMPGAVACQTYRLVQCWTADHCGQLLQPHSA